MNNCIVCWLFLLFPPCVKGEHLADLLRFKSYEAGSPLTGINHHGN